jgi:hypothetical protein
VCERERERVCVGCRSPRQAAQGSLAAVIRALLRHLLLVRQWLLVRVGLLYIGVAVLAVVARVSALACLLRLFAVEEFLEHAHLAGMCWAAAHPASALASR